MEDNNCKKVTAILQGRMGSTRLPGKVFLPLLGKPVMQHVYQSYYENQQVITEDQLKEYVSDAGKLGLAWVN